jgi:predicted HicB family RNase H-like nuclease
MITQEMLAQQEVLNGLTAEQIEAITTLSKNDEEAVIGNRFREVYNRLDETIATTTGIARNGDEKTYNYLERAAKAVKERADKVEGLQTKVQELTNEKARLEKVIQDGTADEQTKKQLAQAQRDLASIKEQFNTLKGEKDSLIEQHTKELLNVRIDNELSQALAGIKLKGDLPEQALNTLIGQTMQHVKGFNPEYVDDGKGGKQLVFKDAQGAILRNPEKGLNPMTAGELLERELKAMGVVDERRAAGGGTEPPKPSGAGDEPIVITGARTRVEANEMLTQQLLKRGLVNGSKQFMEAMRKAWEDNNVKALPEK